MLDDKEEARLLKLAAKDPQAVLNAGLAARKGEPFVLITETKRALGEEGRTVNEFIVADSPNQGRTVTIGMLQIALHKVMTRGH